MSAASRTSWLATPGPTVGVEISAHRIAAVSLGFGARGAAVAEYAVEELPAGAVAPSLGAANVLDHAAVAAAVGRALGRLGLRTRRVALVIPDTAAKVSLVRLESVPPREHDLDRLIRWQVRKSVPFALDEAQVSWTPGAAAGDRGREFVVSVARRDVIEEYERVCAAAGTHAGIVDIATFNLINVVLAAGAPPPAADWLLVHLAGDYATLAILRGASVIFFRNRGAEAGGSVADLVHQTAMYYEDRLGGGGFVRVILAGAAGDGYELTRRELEARLDARVEPIDPRAAAALTDRITASADLLEALAAPVGVVLRERVA